jgi:Integrase core domain
VTLLQDTANPPACSLRQQLKRLRDFQRLYNEQRPHQALGNATPADHYTPSPRRFDGILREPEYGGECEVRRVRHNGDIRWRNRTIYVNQALVGEPVASSRTTPAGPSAMARSCSARSPIKTTAYENPNTTPVNMWTMQTRRPQGHSSNNNRPERNQNCVTYVVGLNCYLCPRLLTPSVG